ncbi:MAG: cobyrinate a,c-diamide synthase [Deltaproteobacteria bacterium]|nr:cobyrinate a,c-diamide synthase [Deltaproteobacteria bacterium]
MMLQRHTALSSDLGHLSANTQVPAFLIGGTTSGSGKTTITLGILAALRARGLAVQPFKCGPDFIDPTLHRMVTGRISSNLDLRMCGPEFCRKTFHQWLSDQGGGVVGVVEGVMGLFDGGLSSSAALAEALDLPVVLVIDARSAAESVAAVLKGFEVYDPCVQIKGVIFNRVGSDRHIELIRGAVEQSCQARILGFFPRDIRFEIPDRHLGLHMGEEAPLNESQLAGLIAAVEKHIDLDALLSLGVSRVGRQVISPPQHQLRPHPTGKRGKAETPVLAPAASGRPRPLPLKLAVARDLPFCFYYEDNLAIFAQAGFELLMFSPLNDQKLPAGMDALYLGGGYPELYASALSRNVGMRSAIAAWARGGGVIHAECGGFMYLCDELIDLEGKAHAMAGVFPATVRMQSRLSRLGYRQPRLDRDCLWGKKGEVLHGHEFHYSVIERMAPDVETIYQLENGRREGFKVGNAVGGYIHLHFGRTEKNVDAFYNYIMQVQKG